MLFLTPQWVQFTQIGFVDPLEVDFPVCHAMSFTFFHGLSGSCSEWKSLSTRHYSADAE